MKKLLFVILALALLVPFAVQAQEEFAAWEDLIPYVRSLEARIAELEAKLTPSTAENLPAPAVSAPAGNTQSGGAKIGKYSVDLKSFKLAKDYSGKDIIVVYFDFTNNSDKTSSFGLSISAKAFQSGIEIDTAYFSGEDSKSLTDIRPGATLEVSEAFSLLDTTSPVELELSELFDFFGSADPVLYTLDLSKAIGE